MKKNLKKEFVYCEDMVFPYKTGYSIGTVYTKHASIIKLFNFGFCPALNEFYFNKNVHLPKRIIKYFEESEYTDELNNVLESLGIHNKSDVEKTIITDFSKSVKKNEIYEKNTLILNKKLKKKNENNK